MVAGALLPRLELKLLLSAPTLPRLAVELVLARREGHQLGALFVRVSEARSLCDASASPLIAPRKLPRRAARPSAACAEAKPLSGGRCVASLLEGTVELHCVRERCGRKSWCRLAGSALTSVSKKAAAAAMELYCPAADCCSERRDPDTELRLDAITEGRRVCSPERGDGREVRRARARSSSVTDARREGEPHEEGCIPCDGAMEMETRRETLVVLAAGAFVGSW